MRLQSGALRAAIALLVGMVAGVWLLLPRETDAATDDNSAPINISCQGWERNSVIISWEDNHTDEASFRVERSIDGAAFTEIATVAANTGSHKDTGIDTAKNYRYRVRVAHADASFGAYSAECNNRRIFETSNVANNGFRLFYGIEGTSDLCPAIGVNDVCLANGTFQTFLDLQKTALEGSADAFNRVGFDRDAAVPFAPLDKIPVNVVWCDGGGCAGGGGLGLSPLLMETAFDLTTRVGDPIAYLVGEHETFHFQQGRYGGLNDPAGGWVIEGQARSSQDKICIGADRATALCFDDINTGYAGYVGEINGYLGNTAQSINKAEYQAALFWTYLTEKFGTFAPGDTVERGMNVMSEFWKKAAATPNRDGIAILNDALGSLGTSMRFRDIWKDFAVANYAKNLTGTGVQAKYKYADMAETGGNYAAVTFRVNQALALNVPFLRVGETVQPWAAHYYRFTPANNVPFLDIQVNQDSSTPLYYTIMGVQGQNVVYEFNAEARNLNQTIVNNAYTEVVVIVAGMENIANYRVSINGTQPTLEILSPTNANRARVGNIAAPEKFRVAVRLLAGNGTPLTGVDLNKFNFRVGTKTVTPDLIITRAQIQDQEWFVLRAPTQDAAGAFDLHVNYDNIATLSVTNTTAVDYTPRVSADSMLIIDRSGSMGEAGGAKLAAAKNAANLYVDSWTFGDKLGVVSFDHDVQNPMTLKDWTDSGTNTRQEAFNVINALTPGGATAIGMALMKGLEQVQTGDPAHDWALVLLSDGKEEGTYTTTFDQAVANIAGLTTKRPVIHAIAIGPSADGPKMQNAANATGGTYQFVSAPAVAASAAVGEMQGSSPIVTTVAVEEALVSSAATNAPFSPEVFSNARLDLDSRYRYIATDIIGHQQFFTMVGPLVGDGDDYVDEVPIRVEGSAASLTFSLSFEYGACFCDITLRDGGGNLIPITEFTNRHYIWRKSTPMGGTWKLRIERLFEGPKAASANSPDAPNVEQLPPYLIHGGIKSDIILDAALTTPLADRVSGVPMPIIATLTEFAPVTGAFVGATVTSFSGATTNLTLFDDGLHGDGLAADGIYGNTFYKTGEAGSDSGAGSYNVVVTAVGNTANAGNFIRQKYLGFFIYSSGDDDADLLPNEFEIRYTGSPTGLDPNADPDGDGASTIDEWNRGTNPLDPDSDDGGEGDNSEWNSGNDPFDPVDDMVEPTWTVAYPGVSKVFVRYAPRAEYSVVQLYRSTGFTETYSYLTEIAAPETATGMYTDTAVTNDQEYCYYAIGITEFGSISAPMTPSCATPKADPWGPDGGFLINEGASKTSNVNVNLTIFASDSVSPHHLDEHTAIMVPPADSATSVTEMAISNNADMAGATFVPYADSAPWVLGQSSGLATVFMQFRDAAGNVSRIIPNTINVTEDGGPGGGGDGVLLPFVGKQE